jgi:hypothetical protein
MKILIISIVLLLSGCADTLNDNGFPEGKSWDFDHQVQFDQQQINENTYYVRVRSTSKTRFARLATFLLRQSFAICKNYGFKIEVLNGVESYNDERYIKSYIPSSLEANVECKPKIAQEK